MLEIGDIPELCKIRFLAENGIQIEYNAIHDRYCMKYQLRYYPIKCPTFSDTVNYIIKESVAADAVQKFILNYRITNSK